MERLRSLDRYQKGILVLLTLMLVVFSIAYPVISSRVGFEYMDTILIPEEQNGNTVYSGKIRGEEVVFTVMGDSCLAFRYGDKTYGPYTVKADPTAIPEEHPWASEMTGVEIRRGEDVLFRGGYFMVGDNYVLHHENGDLQMTVTIALGDGTVAYGDRDSLDLVEPSLETIMTLLGGPKLTSKGQWQAWFLGVFLSVATAVSMLFADELFRWNLAFQIRNVERAEPTEWEIAGRYISWTVMTIMALFIYIVGLL